MVRLSSFAPPTEGVKLEQQSTEAHIQGMSLGSGTLFIAESHIAWFNGEGEGFSLDYPAISLHAVSRDLSAFPKECLYLMVDGTQQELLSANENRDSDEGEDEDTDIVHVRFVPQDSTELQRMFDIMSDCQTLHPDAEDSFSDEEYDAGAGDSDVMPGVVLLEDGQEEQYFTTEAGFDNLTPEGQATLDRLNRMLISGGDTSQSAGQDHMDTDHTSNGQFDDVEPDH